MLPLCPTEAEPCWIETTEGSLSNGSLQKKKILPAAWPEQKLELCVNRTQRRSETSPILLYTLSREIKAAETLQEAG